MNRTDLFCCTVTHMIEPAHLAAFADKVVTAGPIAAAPIITDAHHDHVLTTRYELVPTPRGVIGRTESGESTMTWIEIATHLAEVATAQRADALSRTARTASRQTGDALVEVARADFAHAAATAAGLIDPPLQRQSVQGSDIELRSTPHRTTVSINGAAIVAVTPQQFTAHIDVPAHRDPTTGHIIDSFSETVTFVPRGDSNSPIPSSAGHRIGIEQLVATSGTNERWSLQVDGFDIGTIDVSALSGVHLSVYDEDPRYGERRLDTHLYVPQPLHAAMRRTPAFRSPPQGRSL